MSDLQRYIKERKERDAEFADGYDEGVALFTIGAMLRQARQSEGMTQEALATQLQTSVAKISHIENHADDVKLSVLSRYASALGKTLEVQIR